MTVISGLTASSAASSTEVASTETNAAGQEVRSDGEEKASERYELDDFFDFSPETVMVYKAIGIVVMLALLALIFIYPWMIS